MNRLYAELQWLPRAPLNFSAKLRELKDADDAIGLKLQALATHALDLNQLTKLSNAVVRAQTEGKTLSPLTPFTLAMLSNSTIDLVVPALVASAVRYGIALEIIKPFYDQVAQEALMTGALGFVVKVDVVSDLLLAVNTVMRNERFVRRRLCSIP